LVRAEAKRDKTGELTGDRSPDRHIFQWLEKECKERFTVGWPPEMRQPVKTLVTVR